MATLTVVLLPLLSAPASAQEVSLHGFARTDYIYDTRQVLPLRDGLIHLFPLPESEATDTDNLAFLQFYSRLVVRAKGPEVFGAEVSAHSELDFLARTNETVGSLQLRSIFVTMDWGNRELSFGKRKSPLFSKSVLAPTVAVSRGAPFQPYAWYPQLQFVWKPEGARIIGSVSEQVAPFQSLCSKEPVEGGRVEGGTFLAFTARNSKMTRRGYPSDLTDDQWQRIAPLFALKAMGRPPTLDRREVVNAILYLVRTGVQWRYLPGDFPNPFSVSTCYRRWRLDGTLDRMHDQLRREVRLAAGREAEPSVAVVDSQSAKTTEKGGSGVLTQEKR